MNFSRVPYYIEVAYKFAMIVWLLFVSYQLFRIVFGGSWIMDLGVGAVFAALIGVIVGLVTELGKIRQEIGSVRHELGKEIGGVRQEMAKEMGGLRQEMAKEMGGIRQELGEGIGSIRQEMGNLRADFYKALSEQSKELHGELTAIDKRVARIEHKLGA